MNYKITCPYCFGVMQDHEVLFRSEKVNQNDSDILPEDVDDIDDFLARYRGDDREEILRKYRDWEFFAEGPDETYENFWANFVRTTENNPADEKLGVMAYHRKVIDPANPEHQRYLRMQPDGGYLMRNGGMVDAIQLEDGTECQKRVCRFCHNPLPQNYGKTDVKFVAVIGITGAGKTVYLSQLLSGMSGYAVKAGLSANGRVFSASIRNFIETNRVAMGKPMPPSTPFQYLQQPLFYQISSGGNSSRKREDTLVLYDVAGEVFQYVDVIKKFAPYIAHADGIMLLIDPMQFDAIRQVADTNEQFDEPAAALEAIQNIISGNDPNKKCETPVAICLSKIDTKSVQEVLDRSLIDLLREDVCQDIGPDNSPKQVFNARQYNPIVDRLDRFMKQQDLPLAQMMKNNYSLYCYFAFTAMGCDVRKMTNDMGEEVDTPIGPVLPKRIEEPLLWMLHELKYIGVNEPIHYPDRIFIHCPSCDSIDTQPCEIKVKRGPFRKEIHNRKCNRCGLSWSMSSEK